MTEENEKLQFPITWDGCPNCGSSKRVVGSVKDELIAQDKWSPELEGGIQQLITTVADPKKVQRMLTIPILLSLLDICAECGTVYCVRTERKDVSPTMKKGQGPFGPFGGPPPFGSPPFGGVG